MSASFIGDGGGASCASVDCDGVAAIGFVASIASVKACVVAMSASANDAVACAAFHTTEMQHFAGLLNTVDVLPYAVGNEQLTVTKGHFNTGCGAASHTLSIRLVYHIVVIVLTARDVG